MVGIKVDLVQIWADDQYRDKGNNRDFNNPFKAFSDFFSY